MCDHCFQYFEEVRHTPKSSAELDRLMVVMDTRLDGSRLQWSDVVNFVLWETRTRDQQAALESTTRIFPHQMSVSTMQHQQHFHHSQSISRIVRTNATVRTESLYVHDPPLPMSRNACDIQ